MEADFWSIMGRTYAEWEATQDQALVAKVRAGDEANKVLLNKFEED